MNIALFEHVMDQIGRIQNPKWLKKHIIFLTKYGSHAYGTSLPESDIDIRGICTLPAEVVFGFQEKFEQAQSSTPIDLEIFSVLKFVKLATDCNPNVLELLFVDADSIVVSTPQWEKLREIRHAFLSKRVAFTFAGYAKSQLHRIRTHRNYLLHPVKEIPTREEFGLPPRAMIPKLHAADAAVQKQLDTIASQWSIDKTKQLDIYADVAQALGFETNFVELLYKEKKYAALVSEKEAYDAWAKTRNPKRKALEEKCGYDSKHLMHLVRLYRECIECLTSGTLYVKRPDAAELIEIRTGNWSFDKAEGWAADAATKVNEALAKTTLPARADLKTINRVVQDIVKEGALRNG